MPLSVARLATTRTSERTIASGVLEHPADSSYGKILYVIDIPLPNVVGEGVEKTIISTLQQEYFRDEKKYPVYQFEDSIKQVNAALSELAEEGRDEWVGHIHAAIALCVDNELFVTSAGRAMGSVIRAKSIVSIIDNNSSERKVLMHKTFANLTSGQLSVGDVIIIGNNEIGRHFSPQFLVQSVSGTPSIGVQSMFQAAKRLNLNSVTAVIAKVEPTKAEEDDANETQTVLLETPSNPLTEAKASISTSAQNIKTGFSSTVSHIPWSIWRARLKQLTARYTYPLVHKISRGAKVAIKTIKSEEKATIHFDETENIEPSVSHPTLQRTTGQKVSGNLSRFVKNVGDKIKIVSVYFTKLRPITILAIVVVLLLIVGGSSWYQIKNHKSPATSSNQNITPQLDQAQRLLTQASALSTTQPDQSRKLITESQNILRPLTTNKSNRISELTNQANNQLSSLNNIVYIDTSQKVKLALSTKYFIILGSYIICSSEKNDSLLRITIGKNDAPQTIYSLPDHGQITFMGLMEKEHNIIVATSTNRIFRLSVDGKAQTQELLAPTGQKWPSTRSIAWYQNNLYTLEQSTGKIWKFTSADTIHFSSKQSFLTDSSLETSSSTSITTDGYIYLLGQSGKITKLLKGKPQSFGPVIIPEPGSTIQSASLLATDDSVNSIYIQDKTRIIEINKDGQYARQHSLIDGEITASFISVKSKIAWILVNGYLIGVQI